MTEELDAFLDHLGRLLPQYEQEHEDATTGLHIATQHERDTANRLHALKTTIQNVTDLRNRTVGQVRS